MQYNDLLNDVILDAPGAPVPVALRSVREGVRLFCKESMALRHVVASSELSYSNGVYTITAPIGTQIESVISPMIFNGSYTVYTFSDGSTSTLPTPPAGTTLVDTQSYTITHKDIQGASPEWLDINYPGWRTATAEKDIKFFSMQSNNTFVLTPDDNVNRSAFLVVSLVLMPDRSSTLLDDEFGNRWFDGLVAASKYLLLLTPSTEWTNPELAQYYKAKLDEYVLEAKRYVRTGLRHPQADGINHVKLHY
jgi:hypothetical protein